MMFGAQFDMGSILLEQTQTYSLFSLIPARQFPHLDSKSLMPGRTSLVAEAISLWTSPPHSTIGRDISQFMKSD
jgi:hypothetical protein